MTERLCSRTLFFRIKPDGDELYTQGGQVKLKSLKVHELDSVWRPLDPSEPVSRILLDSYELDLSQDRPNRCTQPWIVSRATEETSGLDIQ